MTATTYSQHGEDIFMASRMPADAAPVVVDVGANDGQSWSNSRLFGLQGWRLLLIEPVPEYAERCRQLYADCPMVSVEERAITAQPGTVEFHISVDAETDELAMRSSLLRAMVPGERVHSIQVTCEPLQALLLRHGIPRNFGVLSVDAEGTDIAVLRSLDLNMFRPCFICVEEGVESEAFAQYLGGFGYAKAATLGPNGIYALERMAGERMAGAADLPTGQPAVPAPHTDVEAPMAIPSPVEPGEALDVAAILAAVPDELHGLGLALDGIGQQATGLHLHAAASTLDLALPAREGWWTTAFNGQAGRSRLFLRLLETLQPGAVVETGTFRGTTTEFMAQNFAGPVFSCEIDLRWHLTAQARLAAYRNVALRRSDSRSFLRSVLAKPPADRLLYYLDAHWRGDLPLREEIALIMASGRPAAIVVDDFAVPFDAGYHYDDYGPGKVLSAALLAGIAPQGAALFFPTLPSADETGARRGCAVIGVGGMVALLAGMTELRPWDWPDSTEAPPPPPPEAKPSHDQAFAPLRRLVAAQHLEQTQARAAAAEMEAAQYRAASIAATALLREAEAASRAADENARLERMELERQLAAAEARLRQSRNETTLLRASLSWRVTAPLRWLRRLFG